MPRDSCIRPPSSDGTTSWPRATTTTSAGRQRLRRLEQRSKLLLQDQLATIRTTHRDPVYAIEIKSGALGTKAARTSVDGEVLGSNDVIPGLYAAATSSARVRHAYRGAGATLGRRSPSLQPGDRAQRQEAARQSPDSSRSPLPLWHQPHPPGRRKPHQYAGTIVTTPSTRAIPATEDEAVDDGPGAVVTVTEPAATAPPSLPSDKGPAVGQPQQVKDAAESPSAGPC